MRVGIIGMGWVGSSVAISTLHEGLARELWLHDRRPDLADGEAMDLAQGASFYPSADVRCAEIEEMRDCDVVVIAAGKGGRPEQSRLDLLRENASIVRDIATELRGGRATIVVVTNPVDVLTHVVWRASGLPPERVIGTGTMLDTARLRQMIGRELAIDPRSVHAHVLGEHGDSEVVAWSAANVGGVSLRSAPGWASERETAIAAEVRTAAYEIIRRKGATNHAIGLVTAHLLGSLLRDERRVLTASRVHDGSVGLGGEVALSLPVVVGREGATRVLSPSLDAKERAGLERSAEVLRAAIASL
ncbi:L-lactate dehydrogenase [Sandaracinus amylolyticus]|uniref:L-lactate dehydrogenase n=1 Tax=Sandaracinus amylolyticus TaxID=927083 RepID=A0A0F6SHV7_9BACT|nr:L-lactate dehydrogenase [Sandaracinus amylolyticus]AKF11114.1 L-lactate dehydrogenase [Sandaracinus amylolyticus]